MRRTEQQKIPMSVRVPQRTHKKLQDIAHERGCTPTTLAQKAIIEWAKNPTPEAEDEE